MNSFDDKGGSSRGLQVRVQWLFFTLALWFVAEAAGSAAAPLAHREWQVDGVIREALVYVPPQARTNPVPLVFVFHGHGGSMQNAARSFSFHTLWPEAMVVYLQGLNTAGRLTDPEGKLPGWQAAPGDQGDRDLKCFDVVLASLKSDYRVDDRRIYATGHSNGGGFTYLLWAVRGGKFAAFAPSAAVAAKTFSQLKPKPVLHIAGENDALVKFAWQQMMMDALRKLNQCGEGQPWEGEKDCTLYPSKLGGAGGDLHSSRSAHVSRRRPGADREVLQTAFPPLTPDLHNPGGNVFFPLPVAVTA